MGTNTISLTTTSLLQRSNDTFDSSLYGYTPTEYICTLFIGLFGLSALIHLGQSCRYQLWWLLPTVVFAGFAEAIGWSGRFGSSQNPEQLTPFLIGMVCTIIAPTPLAAANFIILGRIIRELGSCYSRLPPLWYTIIFCTFDIISLIIQAIGGATASNALENGNSPTIGGNIMLGGIALQMIAITIYIGFAVEFFFRYFNDNPVYDTSASSVEGGKPTQLDKRMKIMIFGLMFSTICLFIRAVYRTCELSNGWSGRIISTQVYFNVLDGAMITLAIYTLNFIHPGFLLCGSKNNFTEADWPLEEYSIAK